MRTVCIDLDGVLAEYTKWQGSDHFGDVIPAGVELCRMLKEAGCTVIIFTCRMNAQGVNSDFIAIRKAISNWLHLNNIEFDHIALHVEGKPFANAYVDDRAVEFDNNSNEVDNMLRAYKKVLVLCNRNEHE